MAIFSVLHLFAFPWQPYTLKNQQASDDPQYVKGQIGYHGGPLGVKAWIESFNPWDLVKATARGFRWLFVGSRSRHLDPSYMHQNESSFSLKTSNDPAVEIGPSPNVTAYSGPAGLDNAYHPANQYGAPSEEGQNLLSNAQSNPYSPYPPEVSYYEDESAGSGNHGGRYYSHMYSQEGTSTGELSITEPRPISPRPYQPYHPQQNSPYEGA